MTGIERTGPQGLVPLAIDLLDGNVVTVDIAQPSWLYAGRVTELDTGASWRFVYRSPLLKGADPLYRRLLDYLDGAVQIYAKRVADSDMMFGQAELSIHEPHSELVVMSR